MASKIWLSLLACITLAHALPTSNDTCSPSSNSSPGPGYEHHEVGTNNYTWPWQIFKSSPLTPPLWEINGTGEPLAPGFIFLTAEASPIHSAAKQPAATIFTDDGQLVWGTPAGTYSNLRVDDLFGKKVLAYSGGTGLGPYGNVTILDDTYSTMTTICPNFNLTTKGNTTQPCQADHHESYITDKGTLLVPGLNHTQADLTSISGAQNSCVTNPLVFEIDIQTQEILFSWNPMDHVPFSASQASGLNESTCEQPVDWFHANSLQTIGDQYLINGRHTNTVYLVNSTGEIVWQFNGDDGGDFALLPDSESAGWKFPHDVRVRNIVDGEGFELSLFNNNNAGQEPSNGSPTELMDFHLSTSNMTATLVQKIITDPPVIVTSLGSYQPEIENGEGHQMGTFGTMPMMKEFDGDGKEVWSGRIGEDYKVYTYRGYKQEWHARPWDLPTLVVERNETTGGWSGFVSWNGATDVTTWNVYVGAGEEEEMEMTGTVKKWGFETGFDVPCWARYVQVGVVEGEEEVRRSQVVEVA